MNFDMVFDRLSLKSLFAITGILFLCWGFVIGFTAGQELEFQHRQSEIEKASLSELGLIRFENDYYHVTKENPFELMNDSIIVNLTILTKVK